MSDIQLPETPDWNEIFVLAKNHNVLPLIFEAASEIESFTESTDYPKFMLVSMKWISQQARRTDEFLSLYRAFVDGGVHPIAAQNIPTE